MHYQFETIHPFEDGNGRTGRILNLLYFIDQQLLTLPILYRSRYILENKRDYSRHLVAATSKQDWEGWITYMLQSRTVSRFASSKHSVNALQRAYSAGH